MNIIRVKHGTIMQRSLLATVFMLICLIGSLSTVFAADRTRDNDQWSSSNSNVQLGNAIVVPKGTVNNGDAVAIFDDVTVLGEVQGNVVAVGGDIRIEGRVAGDVVGVGGRISLSDTAEVNGNVTVVGAGLDRAAGARISGSINNIGIGDFLRHPNVHMSGWHWFGFANPIGYLIYLLGLFALTLLTVSLFPAHVGNVADYMEKDWGRSALVGLLTLLLIAPVTVLVAITVIGIPLAAVLWAGFFLAKMLGYVAMVSLLGNRITNSIEISNNMSRLALGVLILGLIRYVPLLGALASFVVTAVTLGAVVDTKFGTNRPWLPPRHDA